jgi:hypothetical protein
MTIYVDNMNARKGYKTWCHMVSDTSEDELHEFAALIGLRREWFQPKSYPHYDITGIMIRRAINNGARRCEYTDVLRHNYARLEKQKNKI